MTDEERFAIVLDELGGVVVALKSIGLDDVILVGAQVVALEQHQRREKLFELETANGLRLSRGFSFEPDLAVDTEDEAKLAEIPFALQQRGFTRVWNAGRPATFRKTVGEVTVEVDFFATSPEAARSSGLVALRGAEQLRSHPITLPDGVSIRVPDAASFLRPEKTKDCFDLFAYVATVGADAVAKQLSGAPELRESLRTLFGDIRGAGVQDVVEAGLPFGSPEERALLERAVVDLFDAALRT